MPFQSEAQKRWMYKNKPEIAREWEQKTPAGPLPTRVSKNPHAGQTTINKNAYKRKSIMRYPKKK